VTSPETGHSPGTDTVTRKREQDKEDRTDRKQDRGTRISRRPLKVPGWPSAVTQDLHSSTTSSPKHGGLTTESRCDRTVPSQAAEHQSFSWASPLLGSLGLCSSRPILPCVSVYKPHLCVRTAVTLFALSPWQPFFQPSHLLRGSSTATQFIHREHRCVTKSSCTVTKHLRKSPSRRKGRCGSWCQSVSQWSLGHTTLGRGEAEQDGSKSGWWSQAAHIMVAGKGKRGAKG
jgi:hypothetical protein